MRASQKKRFSTRLVHLEQVITPSRYLDTDKIQQLFLAGQRNTSDGLWLSFVFWGLFQNQYMLRHCCDMFPGLVLKMVEVILLPPGECKINCTHAKYFPFFRNNFQSIFSEIKIFPFLPSMLVRQIIFNHKVKSTKNGQS